MYDNDVEWGDGGCERKRKAPASGPMAAIVPSLMTYVLDELPVSFILFLLFYSFLSLLSSSSCIYLHDSPGADLAD